MRRIPNFPGYFATKDGQIWSNKWGYLKCRVPTLSAKGYLRVTLSEKCKQSTRAIHQLVLEAFIGPKPKGKQCRHLESNKQNNNLNNLCWGTGFENQQDAVKHKTHKSHFVKGEKHPNAKLTWFLVRMIRYWYATGLTTYKELAELFDVSKPTIAQIVTCNYWRDKDL